MPAYSANIALSDELAQQVPKFATLLKNFRIGLEEREDMQKQIDVDGKEPAEVATAWVDSHASQIDGWAAG